MTVSTDPRMYQWQRFWFRRTGVPLPWSAGFLTDPDGPLGPYMPDRPVSQRELMDKPCLVLLGESGIGKSSWLKGLWPEIHEDIRGRGERAFRLNLGEYGNEALLVQDLFGQGGIGNWNPASERMHLYLDSLDECQIRIGQLTALLSARLTRFPPDRLLLRIISRSADWSQNFEARLREHWGNEGTLVCEMAPLREVDVETAARARGIDSSSFLAAVRSRNVVGFARKPVTLNFLLGEFSATSELPQDTRELYRRGCSHLCSETPSRLDANLAPSVPVSALFVVAARIAALTSFSGRPIINQTSLVFDRQDLEVILSDIVGFSERIEGEEFQVDESIVRETLHSGLFSPRMASQYYWSHQSYSAYLAAWYTAQRKLTSSQIRDLLVHTDGRVIPQLYDTASWLSVLDKNGFSAVLDAEPELLVRAPLELLSDEDRMAATRALLNHFDTPEESGEIIDFGMDYGVLNHSQLADQLRTYIVDRSRNWLARLLAVQIAERCSVSDLQAELLTLTLNDSESIRLRTSAALCLVIVGNDDTRRRLLPLCTPDSEDADDELRGAALRAVWPTPMNADELFAALTPAQNQNLMGNYWVTVTSHVLPHLAVADLPAALKWAAEVDEDDFPLDELRLGILQLAWRNIRESGVADHFADSLLKRPPHSMFGDRIRYPDFQDTVTSDADGRYILAQSMIERIKGKSKDHIRLWAYPPYLIQKTDVPWLIETIRELSDDEYARMLCSTLRSVWDGSTLQGDLIWSAAQHSAVLDKSFHDVFHGVDPFSAESLAMKEYHSEMTHRGESALLDPTPEERILADLEKFAAGDAAAFWRDLVLDLSLRHDSSHYEDGLGPDLTILPGWQAGSPEIRLKILEVAERYVVDVEGPVRLITAPNTYDRAAVAGYKALFLLAKIIPDRVDQMASDVFHKWAEVIVDFPIFGSGSEVEPDKYILYTAMSKAGDSVISYLIECIDRCESEQSPLSVINRFDPCSDDRLTSALAATLVDPGLRPSSVGHILDSLFRHNPELGWTEAQKYLRVPPPTTDPARETTIVASAVLVANGVEAAWPLVWREIVADNAFGVDLLGRIANQTHGDAASFRTSLSEDQLSALYGWFEINVPAAPLRLNGFAAPLTTAHMLDRLKKRVLDDLTNRGSEAAVIAIQKLRDDFPNQRELIYALASAQHRRRIESWRRPTPRMIIELTQRNDARLVESVDQLLGVLASSLERLQDHLQGRPPMAQFLWDQTSRSRTSPKWRPKQEESLSDYVKTFLDFDMKERGVIVNREVQLRRVSGGAPGERTDILVQAVVLGSKDDDPSTVTVVIEAKGCWNKELSTAMGSQLSDRYLSGLPGAGGLYLVGWFDCAAWPSTGDGKCSHGSIEDLRRTLSEQATALTHSGRSLKSVVLDASLT